MDTTSPPPAGSVSTARSPKSERGPQLYAQDGKRGRTIGRCELFAEIATGGMATIHLGRWIGAGGFNKPVAVKALHPQYARDPEFVAMFLDEARVVARIRHPNVMPTIDLVEEKGELFIVMDYVEGVTLAYLMRKMVARKLRIPMKIALRVMTGVLHGLHAAHEAKDEQGVPLCVIHRDVSPENVLIGVDGYARLIDFGIATALGRYGKTRDGELKGKLSYLSPEQILGNQLTRQADVFAASIVLWQALTNQKLFKATNVAEVAHKVLHMEIEPPGDLVAGIPVKLDTIVMRGLERDLSRRWKTAEEMAEAIEAAAKIASNREVGDWVDKIAAPKIAKIAKAIKAMESAPISAGKAALERPLSIRPAPAESINDELVGDLKAMRTLSDDPLADLADEPPTEEEPSEPDALEWTGEIEPAEPVDEASWQGLPAPDAADGEPPPSSRPDLRLSAAAHAAAEATLAEGPTQSLTERWLALSSRSKIVVGAAALVSLGLVIWIFASLGAWVATSGTEPDASSTAQSSPPPERRRPRQPVPPPTAPTTDEPARTAPSGETDSGAAETPADAGADAADQAQQDAGAADQPDAAAPALGKGKVPTAPWSAPKGTFVPPDL